MDEALDIIEALREEEPEGELAASSPRGDASILQAAARRNRILDKLAAAGVSVHNINPYELQKLAKHRQEEERGQMSYEAHAIRQAKDKVQRAQKMKGTKYRDLASPVRT